MICASRFSFRELTVNISVVTVLHVWRKNALESITPRVQGRKAAQWVLFEPEADGRQLHPASPQQRLGRMVGPVGWGKLACI